MPNNQVSNNELHVIFGTGPVGKATMRALRDLHGQGKQIRMVNRSGSAANIPDDVEVVKGDAYSVASTTALTKGAAAVYQCAQPAYHEWSEKFPPLQAAILEGAAANGAKLVIADNLYMYGAPNGRTLTENSPIAPISKKGQVRKAMAEQIMVAHTSGKVRAAVARASTFFGPEYDVLADFVFYAALSGKAINLYGKLDVPHTFTYIPDFGRALATLGTRDEALGQVWIAPSAPPVTQREFTNLVFAQAGHPPKVQAAGRLMMTLLGLISAGTRETVEMMYEFEQPYIVDSSKITRTFGLQATAIETAIAETVAWFRDNPKAD